MQFFKAKKRIKKSLEVRERREDRGKEKSQTAFSP